VLAIIGLFTYSAGTDDREAQQKAAQLAQKLDAAGLPVPENQDQIVRALGNDGGAVCAEVLILQIYCPDELRDYQDKVNELKTDDVIKN
jgi:hypothetical protein